MEGSAYDPSDPAVQALKKRRELFDARVLRIEPRGTLVGGVEDT